jgi:protein-tyrosine phosphatase
MDRVVAFEGATNFRDLGGYTTGPGATVRTGLVFRSDGLHKLTAADLLDLDALGIRAIYDLRGPEERASSPDPRPNIHVEFWDPPASNPHPQSAQEGERWLSDAYLTMVERSASPVGRLLGYLAEEGRLPAVFHCLGGKDRTGFAAAILLSALGVERETVLDDYELTDQLRGADKQPQVVQAFVAAGVGEPAALAMLSTARQAMGRALARIDGDFGGIDEYLQQCCGVASDSLERLRDALLA